MSTGTRRKSPRELGADAEAAAAQLLERSGLRIVARNFRTRLGEIDLIARDGEVLVFVEVRHRGREDYGGAAASITRAKQRCIIAAAKSFLRGGPPAACRFDAVLIRGPGERPEWIRGAFVE